MKLGFYVPRRYRLGQKSSAALELALFLPILLILLIGTAEILLLYRTEAKLNALAGSVAEMVSLQVPTNTSVNSAGVTYYPVAAGTSTTTASLGDLCKGARYGLQPLPALGLSVAIASVTELTAPVTNAQGTVTQAGTYAYWEADTNCTNNTGASVTATSIGSSGATGACALTLRPAGGSMISSVGDNIIIVRAKLSYPGMVGLVLGSAPSLTQTAYARWRIAASTKELTCTASGSDCLISNPPAAIPCSL